MQEVIAHNPALEYGISALPAARILMVALNIVTQD